MMEKRFVTLEGKRPLRWMLGLLLAATVSGSAMHLWLIWREALVSVERQAAAAQMMLVVHVRDAVRGQEAMLRVLGENAVSMRNRAEDASRLVTGEGRIHGFELVTEDGSVLLRASGWEAGWDKEAARLAGQAAEQGGRLVFGAPQAAQGGGTILPVAISIDDGTSGDTVVAVAGWDLKNLLGRLQFNAISNTANFWLFVKADARYYMLTERHVQHVEAQDAIVQWAGKIETASDDAGDMHMAHMDMAMPAEAPMHHEAGHGADHPQPSGTEHGVMAEGHAGHGQMRAHWAASWPGMDGAGDMPGQAAGLVQQVAPWAISAGASLPISEAWAQFWEGAPLALGWGLLMLAASLAAYRIISRSQAAYERRLVEQASLDPLTGLANRTLAWSRLGQELARAERSGKSLAAIMIDLDNFKELNDARGHEAGDELLCLVAKTLRASVRRSDLISRQGGDEFLVVYTDIDGERGAHITAERVMAALHNAMGEAFEGLRMSVSAGVAIAPRDATEPEELMRKADRAMYEAKSRGRNTLQFYDEELNRKVQRRLAIERGLDHALERGELRLALQPQWDARTGRCIGFEALARWHSHELGEVPPSEFVPIAEDARQIHGIGAFALREAIAACLKLSEAAGYPVRASVNVSAKQFRDDHLELQIAGLLAEFGVKASHLMLEVTESVMVGDVEQAVSKLQRLREMGAGVSVDDFGTGYSSLSYLHRLPATEIKIDKSFVRDMMENQGAFELTVAIAGLGRSLGLAVVAEGVETEEQAKTLRGMGVEILQGFLLGKPMPLDELEAILRRQRESGD